jgi:transaldolase
VMKKSPLVGLEALGQSIWMDYIGRCLIESGELKRLISEDGVSGITSNPSIFEKAIGESRDYEQPLGVLLLKGRSAEEIYQQLTVEDIQSAADLLRPTYDRTDGRDGFVSLEVSPRLAHDTNGTVAEARLLWSLVQRPNAMIKVPATAEGIPAIRQLVGEGLNINITLLFGIDRYEQVVDAYLGGLQDLSDRGKPLKRVASVASFFLSRVDVLVDPMLEEISKAATPHSAAAASLQGEVAIGLAKVAFQVYKEKFAGEPFKTLARNGAGTQRLLWASTSTKNPNYPDTKYVESLIGPETINTLPIETLNAYRDHGHPEPRLEQGVDAAQRELSQLSELGIDPGMIARRLEDEGVQKFTAAYDKVLNVLREKAAARPKMLAP